MSENRNKKVEIMTLNDKMRELTARIYEMEIDLEEILKQKEKVEETKVNLSSQIVETDKTYHQLIKKTKEYEMTLNRIRTSSEACQLKYDD